MKRCVGWASAESKEPGWVRLATFSSLRRPLPLPKWPRLGRTTLTWPIRVL